MKFLRTVSLALLLCATSYPPNARGENNNYLLINMITYDTEASRKAIDYAKVELKKGRPVIIYLEDQSVLVIVKANAHRFKEQQQNLSELMRNGAIVAVCPDCLERFNLSELDLLPGVQIAHIEYKS